MDKDNVALIDLDGTLADYERVMREALVKTMSPADKFAKLDEFVLNGNIFNHEPWLDERMLLIKGQPGFWRNLPVIDAGMRVYTILGELGFRRMVLTKGPRRTTAAWTEKVEWCHKHIPGVGISIVCEDEEKGPHKGLMYGTLLFDDYPPYVEQWLKWRPRGKVLMLDNPHNRSFKHPQVFRVPHKPLELRAVEDELRAYLEAA
jgi:5'-nucleotidase